MSNPWMLLRDGYEISGGVDRSNQIWTHDDMRGKAVR